MKKPYDNSLINRHNKERTEWEERMEQKKAYIQRLEEEKEAKMSLRDFIRHYKEEHGTDIDPGLIS